MDKNNIINKYSKSEFSDFLTNDNTGIILELLDDEGLNILNNSPLKNERIAYILSFSNYKDALFNNSKFIDILLNTDISYFYATLKAINFNSYSNLLKKCFENNVSEDDIALLFSYANDEYKVKLLNLIPNNYNLIYAIINKECSCDVINKLLKLDGINLTDNRLNINSLIDKTYSSILRSSEARNKNGIKKEEIKIPDYLFNSDLIVRLLNKNNIFDLRNILNKLEYCTNTDMISNYIKNVEDNIINNYDENSLIFPYNEIFISFKKLIICKQNDDMDNYRTYNREYLKAIRLPKTYNEQTLHNKITSLYKNQNFNEVYAYLKELSDKSLSDYIIDYHFEENYHNIIIDMQELLRFYYDGNVIIQEEHIRLYEKIVNIDYLSIQERKEIHENLKQVNLKEIFYDDMKIARDIVFESIKEASLDKETLQKYKDDTLSQQMGVDIYKIDNEPFFGIVKTGQHPKDYLPTGHSYSLVGNNGVAVYGNVKNADTFLYDASTLNPEQIIHAFPFDSFTLYKPFEAVSDPTNRVQTLMMPDEITGASTSYTEVLILEKGSTPTDIDEKIKELKRIALYCIDEISEKDIERAKQLGLGIVLVSSKNYIENKKYYRDKFDYLLNSFDASDYTYLTSSYDQEKFENKR